MKSVEQLIAEINTRWPLPKEYKFSEPELKMQQFLFDDEICWEVTYCDGSREDQDPQAEGFTLTEALTDLVSYLEHTYGKS